MSIKNAIKRMKEHDEEEFQEIIGGAYIHKNSSYDPKYCELALDYMAKGYSITVLASKLGTTPAVLRDWKKKHKDFELALTVGKVKQQGYWEVQGMHNVTNKNYNTSLYKTIMAQNFGITDKVEAKVTLHDYTPSQDVETIRNVLKRKGVSEDFLNDDIE